MGGEVVEVRRGRSSNRVSVIVHIHVQCTYILTFGVEFLSERVIIDSWERKEVMSSLHHHKQETMYTMIRCSRVLAIYTSTDFAPFYPCTSATVMTALALSHCIRIGIQKMFHPPFQFSRLGTQVS